MATSTLWAADPLDEAAAIVEAEWLRLQQDQAGSEQEVAALPAETPAVLLSIARVNVVAVEQQLPSDQVPDERSRRPTRRRSAMPVWPTQRSPPWVRVSVGKALSNKGGDAQPTLVIR